MVFKNIIKKQEKRNKKTEPSKRNRSAIKEMPQKSNAKSWIKQTKILYKSPLL
jgi:hypothetical protein